MYDPPAVGEVHRVADLHQDLQVAVEPVDGRALPAFPTLVARVGQELVPGHAFDALHHQRRPVLGIEAERVHRHDGRVLQLTGDAPLEEKRLPRRFGRTVLGGLHRHVALEGVLPREEHPAHASLADDSAHLEVRRAHGRGAPVASRLAAPQVHGDVREGPRRRFRDGGRVQGLAQRHAGGRANGRGDGQIGRAESGRLQPRLRLLPGQRFHHAASIGRRRRPGGLGME